MNIDSESTPLVLVCPAWKQWGTTTKVKPGTIILHSPADEVVPFFDSVELAKNSGLPSESLIAVETEDRLADEESLKKMLEAVERACQTGAFGLKKNSDGEPAVISKHPKRLIVLQLVFVVGLGVSAFWTFGHGYWKGQLRMPEWRDETYIIDLPRSPAWHPPLPTYDLFRHDFDDLPKQRPASTDINES